MHFTQCFQNQKYSFFMHFKRCFQNEEYSCCLCPSRNAFTTRNTLLVRALYAVLLGRGIIFCLCTSRSAFRTRNTLVVRELHAVLLEREILLLFVHFTRCFYNEEYSCCLCTSRGAFRTRNTLVFCALRALLFSTTKTTVVVCALHAMILERGMFLLFVHFAWHFQQCEDLLVCAFRVVKKNLPYDIRRETAQPQNLFSFPWFP